MQEHWQEPMRRGDTFTIEGHERGLRGQLVVNGINPVTRRKCRAVGEYLFTYDPYTPNAAKRRTQWTKTP